VEDNKLRQQIM